MTSVDHNRDCVTPLWIKKVKVERLAFDQFFEHNDCEIDLDESMPGVRCLMVKSDLKPTGIEGVRVFDCIHGHFAIDNCENFFQGLIGVPFDDLSDASLARKLSLYMQGMPETFLDVFGLLVPDFNATLDEDLVCVQLKLVAEDCQVASNVYAPVSFWKKVTKSESINIACKADLSEEPNRTWQVPFIIGKAKVKKSVLSTLEVGDILRMDESYFNADGNGVLQVGSSKFKVDWVERSETETLKIKERAYDYAS